MIMRLTKKAAALLVAATMIVSMGATPAFATQDSSFVNPTNIQTDSGTSVTAYGTAQSGYTKLTYEVTSGYTWSIPADVTFNNSNGVDQDTTGTTSKATVKVSNCKLPKGYTLNVTVKGDGTATSTGTTAANAFSIKSGEGQVLDYEIKKGSESDAVAINGNVLSVGAGTASSETTLSFTLKTKNTTVGAAEVAGNYTGYAIFTAQATNGNT